MRTDTRATLCALVIIWGCSDEHVVPTAPDVLRPRLVEYTATAAPAAVLDGYLGSSYAIARRINDLGAITGESGGPPRAVVWHTGTTDTPVSTVPSTAGSGAAFDINSSGQLVGADFGAAILWSPDGNGGFTRTDVGLPGGVSRAMALNENGHVVGYSRFGTGFDIVTKCFLWTPTTDNATSGTVEEIPGLGGSYCAATDINRAGQIAAIGNTASSPTLKAIVRSNGVTVELQPGSYGSTTTAINNAGQIVGSYRSIQGSRAAIWNPSGSGWTNATEIVAPSLSGQGTLLSTIALDINDAGFVVGRVEDVNFLQRAFFWNDGTILELADPLPGSVLVSSLTNVLDNRIFATGSDISPENTRRSLRWTISLSPVIVEGCEAQFVRTVTEHVQSAILSEGDSRSLLGKLDASLRQAAAGKTTAAANLLNALKNEIAALERSGRLTAVEAGQLQTSAQCVIESL